MNVKDPIIRLRGEEILARLSVKGWRLKAREESDEWRYAALWVIESDWSPQGFQLYFVFLTDPELLNHVWALTVSPTYPIETAALANPPFIRLRNVWETELPGFLNEIEALRTQAATSTTNTTVE